MRCNRCGKPLGVYEPVRVALRDEAELRITSVAAEPEAVDHAEAAWHLDCATRE
jgi:hypothetical protein